MSYTTFSTFKSGLAEWIGNVGTTRLSDATRGVILNMALRYYAKYDFRYFEKTGDGITTVASTSKYALPSRWLRPHTLWYTHPTNSGIVFLTNVDKEKFDSLFPDSTKVDLPTHYTVWAGNYELGKTPDQVITINERYYEYLADLDDDNTTTPFLTDHSDMILFRALVIASESYGLNDRRVANWRRALIEIENGTIIGSARARTSGRKAQSSEPG